jgi:Sulfotransferase family
VTVSTDDRSAVTPSRLPNLIIAGPGKTGTTSLFWYLSQHPSICPASVKEIRYFAPITHGDGALAPLATYAEHFAHCGDERYRLEASPQYFHGGRPLIEAMRDVLPDPRIIIILRDPVDRLWSTYRSLKVRRTLPASTDFDAYVAACERLRARREPLTLANRAYWTLSGSLYAEHVRGWIDAFGSDLRIVFFERLRSSAPELIGELCRWLGIDDRPAASFNYTVENETVANRSRILHRIALAANGEGILRDRRRLKAPLRKAYYVLNRERRTERISPATRARLVETFGAANATLAAELRDAGYDDLPDWLTAAEASHRHLA